MKRYLIIIVAFIFCACFFAVGTLGLFESSRGLEVHANLAKWTIKVNDQLISGLDTSFNVTNFTLTSASNVADNTFAPGTSAYFDLTFDPSGTQVALKYDIEFDFSTIINDHIVISSIEETSNGNVYQTGAYKYSGLMSLEEVLDNEIRNFRITLTWIEDGTGLNDEIDYQTIANNNRSLIIPVHIHVIQDGGNARYDILKDKLTHIISSTSNYVLLNEDYIAGTSIYVLDLLSSINYLNSTEELSSSIDYINNISGASLKTLELNSYEEDDEIVFCISKTASNQTLLGEDADFSVYESLGYYCS